MTYRQLVLLEKEFLELDGAEVLRVAASGFAVRCHNYRCASLGCSRCRNWANGYTGCGQKVYCFFEPSTLVVWLTQRFLPGDKAAVT